MAIADLQCPKQATFGVYRQNICFVLCAINPIDFTKTLTLYTNVTQFDTSFVIVYGALRLKVQ